MKKKEIEGEGHRFQGRNLKHLMDLASSDNRVLAIMKHPGSQVASFLSYLEGTASPKSQSWPGYVREDLLNPQAWPVYVREDLIDPSWKVGSYIKLGENDFQPLSPTGRIFATVTKYNFLRLVRGILNCPS